MKKILEVISVTFLIGLNVIFLRQVSASTVGASVNTTGSISFGPDLKSAQLVDPINPNFKSSIQSLNSKEKTKNMVNPLSIDYISNIRFEALNGSQSNYFAKLDQIVDDSGTITNRPDFIQVTDNRGNNAGWHLTVMEDAQFTSQEGEVTGARLKMEHGIISSPTDNLSPAISSSIELTPGATSDVFDAKANQGMGTWLLRFGENNTVGTKSISLTLPKESKNIKGEISTSMTWTLSDSPD